ncbi:MAG: serine/threonine-protein kinase [Myxococcales bacterium]|nr:serine/threonine-protein kinase [Myxococcales bacterium]
MNFLCPSCRTPLPREQTVGLVTCTQCAVQVDLTGVDTAPGQARLWPEVDLKGETVSGHLLVQRLGSGGMGTVYEAESAVGAPVAMKVLSPMLAAEPSLRERFRREARALTKVKHPRVVQLFEEGEDKGFCWYSMELVKGLDLRHRIDKGPMSAADVDALAVALLEALAAVHEAGVVHRDIKPGNILIGPEGPRLCDFGIAQVSGATTLTESAAMLGSLRYMAPEQRWGKADDRSDLYSLGVVLHEALSGGVPGEQPLPGSVPKYLERFIERLTHQNPVQRPASAAEATKLLGQLRKGALSRLAIGGGVAAALVVLAIIGGVVSGSGTQKPLEKVAEPLAPSVVDAGVAVVVADVVDAGSVEIDMVAAPTGLVSVRTKGATALEIDGSERPVPTEPLALAVGTHALRFVCPSSGKVTAPRYSRVFDVDVVEGKTAALSWSCTTMKPFPELVAEAPTKIEPGAKPVAPKPVAVKPLVKKPVVKKPAPLGKGKKPID